MKGNMSHQDRSGCDWFTKGSHRTNSWQTTGALPSTVTSQDWLMKHALPRNDLFLAKRVLMVPRMVLGSLRAVWAARIDADCKNKINGHLEWGYEPPWTNQWLTMVVRNHWLNYHWQWFLKLFFFSVWNLIGRYWSIASSSGSHGRPQPGELSWSQQIASVGHDWLVIGHC